MGVADGRGSVSGPSGQGPPVEDPPAAQNGQGPSAEDPSTALSGQWPPALMLPTRARTPQAR
eukprot:3244028-Alexandrium_andersonii.AAC.1